MSRMKAIAAKILADYKEHYDFPPQGESHMEDCIMDALQFLESVRSEALREAEEAAKSAHWHAHEPLPRCLAAIRALQSSEAVHSTELRK